MGRLESVEYREPLRCRRIGNAWLLVEPAAKRFNPASWDHRGANARSIVFANYIDECGERQAARFSGIHSALSMVLGRGYGV